jgi:hypothetical protein
VSKNFFLKLFLFFEGYWHCPLGYFLSFRVLGEGTGSPGRTSLVVGSAQYAWGHT